MNYKLDEIQEIYLENTWKKVQRKFSAEQKRNNDTIPYIAINGKYEDVGDDNINWWTNGFWAGILWQMKNVTKEDRYQYSAELIEKRLDLALSQFEKLDHDVGFIWLSTAVANYKLTENPISKVRGIKAAEILASRYNLLGEYILAWNGAERNGQIIIDCLMNLPLLYWATKETGDPRFSLIADKHARTASNYLIRADGSVNHIAQFNAKNGVFEKSLGGQGYGENSSWSRGQSWAIYGMMLAFENTKNEEYLNQAKNVAHYFIANIALTDFTSLIDFRAPQEPQYFDTTATAIAACGLLKIARQVPKLEGQFYFHAAWKMFSSLTEKYCDFDVEKDGLLTHGSAKYHRESDREVAIVYGDYFYLELLLRLKKQELKIY